MYQNKEGVRKIIDDIQAVMEDQPSSVILDYLRESLDCDFAFVDLTEKGFIIQGSSSVYLKLERAGYRMHVRYDDQYLNRGDDFSWLRETEQDLEEIYDEVVSMLLGIAA